MSITLGESGIVVGAARTERTMAIEVVREFMDALAHKNFSIINNILSENFLLTISGNFSFTNMQEFIAFSETRYSSLQKFTESFEASESSTGIAIYLRGTISGAWLDGVTFKGVRFCDRFLVAQGRIFNMQTWSDLAEYRNLK